ncbi:hypothetical protein QTP88_002972 [Uroleucon formosanum]
MVLLLPVFLSQIGGILFIGHANRVKFWVSGQFIIMPRAPRAPIGRRTANATRMYDRRQQDNTLERSQTLAQEQRNALSMKSAFNYQSEIDCLHIKRFK